MSEIRRIGGQALFHGVMMRCGGRIATAIREKDGTLTVTLKETKTINNKIRKIPLIRGLAALGESAAAGIRSAGTRKKQLPKLILGVVLYFAVAYGLAYLGEFLLGKLSFPSYLLENLAWMGFFLLELLLLAVFLRLLPPIRRLFGYHAAEHMSINCYEQGMELTIENVRKCSRIHQRCGTNLAANCILLVLIFEIFLPHIESDLLYYTIDTLGVLLLFAAAYEAMRYGEKHDNRLSRIIGFFGGILQKLVTTLPPTDEMLECGIAALKKGIEE